MVRRGYGSWRELQGMPAYRVRRLNDLNNRQEEEEARQINAAMQGRDAGPPPTAPDEGFVGSL